LLIASLFLLVKKTWNELDEHGDLKVIAHQVRISMPRRSARPGEEAHP